MSDYENVSLDDIHTAQRAIDVAVAIGEISEEEGARRREAVLHAVTARDLYKASGGIAGSSEPTPQARAERRKAVGAMVGLIVFAIVALGVVTWGLAEYASR